MVNQGDLALFSRTDSAGNAARTILNFYNNYDSMRYIGELIVLRIKREPTAMQLADLNSKFAHIIHDDRIRVLDEPVVLRRDPGHKELVRLAFPFGKHDFGDLHQLIAEVNKF